MTPLKRITAWLAGVTTPPTRPEPSNILSHPEVTRTFVLHCPKNFFGVMQWDQIPPHVVEDLVTAFNENGGRVDGPYIQFYADSKRGPCITGIAQYDEAIRAVDSRGTLSNARGKIRPAASTTAKIAVDDGYMVSATFTQVRLEFTVDGVNERQLRDMVLDDASISISPQGEIHVTTEQ